MTQSENLTIMFTDIADFTAITSLQTREENEALLKTHDNLLLPVVRSYKGRLVKKIGDALLIVFRSPTDAIHCGMSMQDALWGYNNDTDPARQIHIRVALNQGDVRLEEKDVFGEPVNIAARTESITPSDEIYFTASVFLAMNKAEISYEPLGSYELKGIPDPVVIYRVKRFNGNDGNSDGVAYPFNKHHLIRLPNYSILDIVRKTEREMQAAGWLSSAKTLLSSTNKLKGGNSRTYIAIFLLLALLGAGGFLIKQRGGLYPLSMVTRAEDAMDANRWSDAQQITSKALGKDPKNPDALMLKGHLAFHENNRKMGLEYYEKALGMKESLKYNQRFVRNLVSALNSVQEKPREMILRYKSDALVDALVKRAAHAGYAGRGKAIACLKELGSDSKVDVVEVALLDLDEVKKCDTRRTAVLTLQSNSLSVGQRQRALPLLKRIESGRANDTGGNTVSKGLRSLSRAITGGGDDTSSCEIQGLHDLIVKFEAQQK